MKDIKKFGMIIASVFAISFLGLVAFWGAIEPIIYHAYEGPIFPLTAVSSTEGITVEAVYPFAYSLNEKKEWIPKICIDGTVTETQMVFIRR